MWQNLHLFLCLWIAIWITDIIWFLQIIGISWAAAEMISRIRKPRCLISVYFLTSTTNMVRRAGDQVINAALACSSWIYYHFDVSSHICQNITITWISIVLPTASYIKKIKLTVGPPSLFYIKCHLYLEVWRFLQLKIKSQKTNSLTIEYKELVQVSITADHETLINKK